VVEAAAIDLFRSATAGPSGYSWATTHERTRAKWRKNARVTIATALAAWPGVWEYKYHDDGSLALILPLKKDAADE